MIQAHEYSGFCTDLFHLVSFSSLDHFACDLSMLYDIHGEVDGGETTTSKTVWCERVIAHSLDIYDLGFVLAE